LHAGMIASVATVALSLLDVVDPRPFLSRLDSVLWAVLVLGGLIFVHELGHFLVAKRAGVRVLKFSLGFGPKIIGFSYPPSRLAAMSRCTVRIQRKRWPTRKDRFPQNRLGGAR